MEDQKPKPMNHLDALSDELGIDVDALEKIPQVLANFKVGGKACSLGGYQIVELIKDDQGNVTAAKIKINKDPAGTVRKLFAKSKTTKKWVRVPDDTDEEELILFLWTS